MNNIRNPQTSGYEARIFNPPYVVSMHQSICLLSARRNKALASR